MPKTYEIPLYKNIRVVLCKTTARKNTKYSKNEAILETDHLAKGYSLCKGIAFEKCQFGSKIKIAKDMKKNHSSRTFELFFAKNRSEKHKNIRVVLCKTTARKNTKYSKNEVILEIGHLAKGYSLCKTVSLGQ